ncbi:DUF2705 family protein [Lactiplantibacillus paraplantarum]|uniref:Uncharacterized protein n=1 Tax=Lactiplantibacillus paraplantarum TaxID=60520 RepID=A0AAD0TN17_9LACO|nr:DUF2705 family protein [Lactiplantibacillus paraplantarum]AVW09431.1 hypothetical protein DA077_02175 [Lactiplantibacillus paraplantarum]AYJ37698.1 hypothetical protein LP667_02080 [Lactiplantibacillus paraplantarum]ERL43608.1 hypothetical protein N644_2151 [Lactiplantibacillus paraplantarum]KRL46299.1 hypothetical protein FD48_GL002227 [Lactiplantibacillus paraplantarum DSM 10667]MCU4682648.1 DUF2705 family protein [Lactiplantibacillus paraplantarum]
MKRRLQYGVLLLIALVPVVYYAHFFEGLHPGTVYFYTDGLPPLANPYLVRIWFFPIIALLAVNFNFVHHQLHGPFIQTVVRTQTRSQLFGRLYATKIGRQMGVLMGGLVVYLLCRMISGYAVWWPNWTHMGLSLLAFLLLFSIQFVGDLFVEPLIVYIVLNVYVFVSVSLPAVNMNSVMGLVLFPNALMACRVPHVGLYYGGLLVMGLLFILIGRYRFSRMDLL